MTTIEKKTIRSDIPGHNAFLSAIPGHAAAEDPRRLTVGRDIALAGDIAACEYLVIEGTVKAEGFRSRRMDILEPGLFAGAAEVQDAVIAGRFEGRLVVTGRLTLKPTARVSGEIAYGALEAEIGARIEGQIGVLSRPVAEQPQPAAEEQAPLPDNVEALFEEREDAGEKKTGKTGSAGGRESPRVYRRAAGF